MKVGVLIFLAFMLSGTFTVEAKDIEVILIKTEIYSIPASKELTNLTTQLEEASLEKSPKLIVNIGEDAKIETGAKESEILSLYFKFDQTGKHFDIDFQLNSKGNQSISKLEGNPLNSSLTISASINNVTKIVKIKTQKFNNRALALASESITREELATEVAYCYAAHKKLQRREFRSLEENRKYYRSVKSGNDESQKYISLIDYLIGSANTYKYINNATLRQEGRSLIIQAKRYCSQIDQKLTLIED